MLFKNIKTLCIKLRPKHSFRKEVLIEKLHVPDPATPTVAAPAPMNLAAESMSLVTAEV